MTNNPFINAFAALAYIGAVVLFMFFGPIDRIDAPEMLIALSMLSLLTLSVLVMGYIFFLEPVKLYFDGHKKEAIALFVRSIAIFGATVLVLLGTLLFAFA